MLFTPFVTFCIQTGLYAGILGCLFSWFHGYRSGNPSSQKTWKKVLAALGLIWCCLYLFNYSAGMLWSESGFSMAQRILTAVVLIATVIAVVVFLRETRREAPRSSTL